ncbi:uncharacterized protein LOC114531393 [Dendronephthya gigantea]|uniref:uncharacterized protein LOC114531393 n=1 Tax=Dendronephthya gigantea TaxID=151771 RepID=UPI00106ACFBB|nr:uncharacterized protein LOC114531393 [Dendronephthya gigantea]
MAKRAPFTSEVASARCFKPTDFGKVVSRQIHILSDASSTGYGAVAYLRLCDENDRIYCSFLLGKACLAPIKIVTIPRLELTATAIAVRIGELLKNELDDIFDMKYHTDSTNVLCYIMNEQQRFHVFVANRIQLIRNYSDPSQWRYVSTDDNPADDTSRGTNGERLSQQRQWFEGPEFLWKPEHECPQQPVDMGQINEDDPEIKQQVESNKAVAVFLRIKKILQDKIQALSSGNDENFSVNSYSIPLSVKELAQAEIVIIKFIQSTTFHKEMMCLQFQKSKKRNIKKIRSIYCLDPYLKDGILRVGGWLNRAELSPETAHPIILPHKNHVTTLIIRHLYRQLGHVGRNHVISAIREKYWLIKINAAVRRVLSKCVFCLFLESSPSACSSWKGQQPENGWFTRRPYYSSTSIYSYRG